MAALKRRMDLGVPRQRLVLERNARNTWENAEIVYNLVKPKPGDKWLLVTSAFHMPRAVGVFRRFGWAIIPYPVDYHTSPDTIRAPLSFAAGLGTFENAFHEWLGLLSYWIAGKTDAAFPGPMLKE